MLLARAGIVAASAAPTGDLSPVLSNNWQVASLGAGTSTLTLSYTVAADQGLLVVGTAAKDLSGSPGNTQPTSVTWNGNALTKVGGISSPQESGNEEGSTQWVLLNPAPGTGDLVATWPEAQATGAHLFATCLAGGAVAEVPDLVVTSASASDDALSFSVTVTDIPAGSLCIDCSALSGGTAYTVSGTGQVQKVANPQSTSWLLVSETSKEAAGNATMGWTSASGNYGRRAVVIAVYGNGSPPPPFAAGAPNLTHTWNTGLLFFVGGHPLGSTAIGRESVFDTELAYLGGNGDVTRVDPDHADWLAPQSTVTTGGGITSARSSAFNAALAAAGTRYALWADIEIDAAASGAVIFSIPWRDAGWTTPFGALVFQRDAATDRMQVSHTNAAQAAVTVTSAAGAWPATTGRHKLAFVRDGDLIYFLLDGEQVGAAVAGAGSDAPNIAAAPQQHPVCLLTRSDTAPAQGIDGALIQMRGWALGATSAATTIARLRGLQLAPDVGRKLPLPRAPLPLGTLSSMSWAQVPSDSRFVSPTFPSQLANRGLPVYGVRHILTMRLQPDSAGYWLDNGVLSSFKGPWIFDQGGENGDGYTSQWNEMHAHGMYLLGCLFEGAATAVDPNNPGAGAVDIYPRTAEQRNDWADQAIATIKYCEANWPGMLVAVEIENECDANWFVPAADVCLIAAAFKAKMRADPALDHILIVGPALTISPPSNTYVDAAIAGGFLNSIDVWTQHPYAPAWKWKSTRTDVLRSKFTAAGHPTMPIFLSEWGGHGSSNAYDVTAGYSVMAECGVIGASYFPCRDYGTAFGNNGFLDSDGKLAVQGEVWLYWRSVLADATFIGSETLPGTYQANIMHFLAGAEHVRVVWGPEFDTPSVIAIAGTYTIRDHLGNLMTGGPVQVVHRPPVYIHGNVTITLSATQDTLLADAWDDFSLVQGQGGWTYQSLENGVYTNAVSDGTKWTAPGVPGWSIDKITSGPGQGTHQTPKLNAARTASVNTSRKWGPVPAGVTRIRVRVYWGSGSGDGSGVSLWRWHLGAAQVRYRNSNLSSVNPQGSVIQVFDVEPGDIIEFRTDNGPSLDDTGDNTVFNDNICAIYKTIGPVTPVQDDVPAAGENVVTVGGEPLTVSGEEVTVSA